LEAQADHKGEFDIPAELLTAHIVVKTGWTVQQVRATPQHEIDNLLLYWHLQSIAEKAQERKSK
jgi:hypothetical protein